ncbi:glycosyltransferase family 2 protein [Fictibacillus nanhaiensis]|uniref:glycosyltransferase family A protein n=1 Tax=Fictibacillus nanhaiensis TaxID=742169 RepID=UPI001C9543C7|nr:glycosyltransferase family A protein [Fictibacillus nanhaiensis]MBY6036299.1 glycosyltransferase family 2 protein [Fictibacillus nanhaiensis]
MELKKVSIIIPFYNCEYVDKAIESAIKQTYKNIEIIVVNDGSTMYKEKIIPYLKKIKYIEKSNGGTASALNAGIQNATGDYFSWLSSDDIYVPDKIEKQLHFMQSNKFSVSYSNFLLINERGSIISSPLGTGLATQTQFLKRMRRGCIINGCTVMLDMHIFKEFGLFDETLPYTHDYDYWLRILSKYHFHYYQDPLVNYRIHNNMGTIKHSAEIKLEIRKTIRRHKAQLNELVRKAVQNGL